MLSKQFVCGRRSKAVLSILFLLSSISATLYGGPGMSRFDDDEGIPELTKKSVVAEWCPEELGGHDPKFLQAAYNDSSQDVRYIIDFLKDPNYALGEEDRFAIFYGKPGTGKTVQSFVVPYMAGWHCAPRVPSQVQIKERNGTARNLTDDIARALEPGEKVVYVMQEFNKLVDHANSTSHDADTASTALWTALDAHNKNPNFYFIGTTNNLENIPEQLKDRFIPQIIEFQGIQTLEAKKNGLMAHILSDRVRLSSSFNDAAIDNLVKKISPELSTTLPKVEEGLSMMPEDIIKICSCSSQRDLRVIGILARRFARFDNPTGYYAEVTEEHAAKAIERMWRIRKLCRYGTEEESEYAQRERQHSDSLAQQETHHARTVDQSYQLHGLSLVQEILRSRHTTIAGSISNNGVKDLYKAQPKEVQKYIDFKEKHGALGALRAACIDSALYRVQMPRKLP